MLTKNNIQNIYPLSPMQEGMYFHSTLNNDSTYREQISYRVKSKLDVLNLEKSINTIIERHDALRTVFVIKADKILQCVLKQRVLAVYYNDITSFDDKESYIQQYKDETLKTPFDLSKDLLLRIAVLKLHEDEFELVWTFHHILMDGWCMGAINMEFIQLYLSYQHEKQISMIPVRQYRDYISWLENRNKEGSLAFWVDYLRGFSSLTELPVLLNDCKKESDFSNKSVTIALGKETSETLNQIAVDSRVTINTLFQSVWGCLLGKYNDCNDVTFGGVVSGRPPEIIGVETIVGLFINTIPIRIGYKNDETFSNLLNRVQGNAIRCEPHHYSSLAEIQSRSGFVNGLFDNILVFENYPVSDELNRLAQSDEGSKNFNIVKVDVFEQTNYNFVIKISTNGEYKIELNFNSNKYGLDTVNRITSHITEFIQSITKDSNILIKDISLISEEEKYQVLNIFNNTKSEYPKDKTIHQLIEEQAERTPDNIAIVLEEEQISYSTLNERSNQLAWYLIQKGVVDQGFVAILYESSLEVYISILSVLKTGKAYLPIDSSLPESRISFMLEDCGVELLLASNHKKVNLNDKNYSIRPLDTDGKNSCDSSNLNLIITSSSPAYAIYTSGSSGIPKGVVIAHRSLVNLCFWHNNFYELNQKDHTTKYAGFGFDASVWEIFPCLTIGASLHIIDESIKLDVAEVNGYFNKNDITVSFLPTQFCEKFMELDNKSLRILLTGGDVLRYFKKQRYILYNNYGPTENTVVTTSFEVRNSDNNIPIGIPIGNTLVYILDVNNQVQPVGVPGELCISGDGLALGYLNNPLYTAEKFINNPFEPNEKLYRTGDLARWLSDGNIEFLGRIDQQVKLRGFRIELGEIENALLKHESIRESVVVSRGDNGDKFLCAYVVCEREVNKEELRTYLSASLPDYMIPSYFVQLEKLPLTANDKIDRKSLPAPEYKAGSDYSAPTNPIEIKLVSIWSDVLNIPKEEISTKANFFAIGGHSLRATIMISKIHKELIVKVPLTEVFIRNTVKELAKYISTASRVDYSSIRVTEKREYYALSSAQKRLYFLQQFDLNSISYNMPRVIPLNNGYDLDKFEATFRELVKRHESFRTSFITINNNPVQRVHDSIDFRLEIIEVKEEEVISIIHNLIRPFNLASDNLLRAYILKIPKKQNLLVIDMHHIISDGTTGIIVVEDFLSILAGHFLAPLKLQYKDFSEWQNKLFRTGEIDHQEKYWKTMLSDELPRLNLLTDYKRPDTFTFKGDIHRFTLNEDISEKLLKLGEERNATLFMNVLALLNVLFYKYTNQTDIIIGSGVAGRPHADLQRISGMFINTLVMRNKPKGEKTYAEFLDEVIRNSINAFDNQDVQFEDLVDKLNIERDPSRNPLYDISMVVQNFAEIYDDQPNTSSDENNSYNQNINYRHITSKFDITFFIYKGVKKINFIIEYYSDLFNQSSIIRLSNHFQNLVNIIISNPAIKLDEIDILSKEEKQTLVETFNDTEVDYLKNKTFQQNFEQIVNVRPDAVAITFQDCHITYKQLNEKANQLGNYLHKECNIGKDDLVGIYLQRSALQIISILGVFKSGGAYVPIDTSLPEERIKTIINDSRLKVLISQKSFNRELNRLQWMCKNLDTYICLDSDEILNEQEVENNELMDPKLWEYVGETATDEITGGGWTSSYTGETLSQQEMNEYGDNILQKVLPLVSSSSRVLEIGCASGISMFRIAPHVSCYCGTDISNVIISKNRERANKENFKNIDLKTLAAHELDLLGEDKFDLIIINSVIQCFNGHNYLLKVIKNSIDLLSDKGFIFLGDVMDQDLKEALQQSLEEFKGGNKEMPYKTKIDLSSELFVSKGYIADLQVDIPEIIDINFSNKIHTIENELTKYRYDALIKIDKNHRSGVVHRHKSKHQHDLKNLEKYSTSNLALNSSARDLAYIIYTSGTTGIPKGVMIEHRGLSNLSAYSQKEFCIDHHDKVFQFANTSFDASVWEIHMALLGGACLTLIPEGVIADKGLFEKYLERYSVTVVLLPPPYLNLLDKEKINTLRLLLTGGSETNASLVNRWRDKVKYINAYGPTETTICSTLYKVDEDVKVNGSVPIGKPIYNAKIFILNKNRKLQPIGVAGELCVSGDILSRGYLFMPELTAQKFVPNPFLKGELMYRTGDLARWLNDGNIEFLGRIDDQVKVRGYRIELGEIESHLQKHEDIKENVVISIKEDGDTYICAYYVSDDEIESSNLVAFLAKTLPRYMIPQYFMYIEFIPLNSSGKVNRKLLPLPKEKIKGSYLAPESNVELKLLKIWSDILGVKENLISVDANFFELGGHSLRATTLVSRIHKEFQVQFELRSVFQQQTIREQAVLISQLEQKEFVSIPKTKKKDHYQLTSAQKRLFLLQQLDLQSTAYNLPYIITLDSMFDKQKVEKAFQQLIARHESFRTSFDFVDNLPVQLIHDNVDFEVNVIKVSKINVDSVRDSFIRPFNLSKAPLLRVSLVDVIDSNLLLMIDMHHIISDGTSHSILEREFNSLYNGQDLKPIKLQYRDFSDWQNSTEQLDRVKGQEKYWLDRFTGELPILSLTTDYQRPPIQGNEGANARFALPQDLTDGVRKMAREQGLTLYMTLLGAYVILLSKLSGQEDIVVGTPIAGRRHADLDGVVGMFVNTLALRVGLTQDQRIKEYYTILKGHTLEAFENQEYQFEDLVDKLALNRDLSRNPLFDVMFNLLNQADYGLISERSFPNTIVHEKGTSKFDLNLAVADFGNQLVFHLEYSTKLFRPERIDQFIKYFRRIVACINSMSESLISEIDILSTEEKHQLLYKFNDTKANYPKDKTIPLLFEEQVERIPNNIAIKCKEEKITYKELNIRSNKLANHLINKGFANTLIAIMAERSMEMIVGIFGILKSGNAYLPLDPKQPLERNQKILKDSQTGIVLTNIDAISLENIEIIHLKDECISKEHEALKSGISEGIKLSYVIYTSGSTGVPKGVMVTHESLVNFVTGISNLVFPNKLGSLLSLTTISFDIFGLELYVPLLNGRTMVLATEEDQIDSAKILSIVQSNDVRILQLTPSRLRLILSDRFFKEIFERIEVLLIGGEEFPPVLLSELRRHYKGYLYNMYGPTETAIWSTYKDLSGDLSLNIGRPIANTEIYILGSQNELQPIGVSGELCIGGDGLANGYLNNPLLTSEKFILNPLIAGKKIYRTGDLARWLPDGNIEFQGRIDHQVKIRGFRIELGEIENALLKHESIKESVVIAREDNGDKYLCAYLVCKGEIDKDALRTYLSNNLPDYMVPSYFVELKELPLTTSGKVDRRSLPSPEYKSVSDYVAPSSTVELKLAEIWSEVLTIPVEKISITENFFSLGGHSLKAILLINRIRKVLEVEVSLSAFMINPTIKYLSLYIRGLSVRKYASIRAFEKKEYYPISSVQKRFYFIQNLEPESTTFNTVGTIPISKKFSYDKILSVFNSIIERHDAFRTFFVNHNNSIVQRIVDKANITIETCSIKMNEIDRFVSDYRNPFDLNKYPILKVVYFIVEDNNENDYILYNTHHIFTDGQTHQILENDFLKLVNNENLAPLRFQYKDYSEWQNSKEHETEIKEKEKYWLEVFKDGVPEINLPTDFSRPEIINWDDFSCKGMVYDFDYVNNIRKLTDSEGVSLYMFFFSIINLLLNKISGNNDFVIGSYTLGRNMVELENIVGAFINTLVVRNTFSTDISYKKFLQNTAQNIVKATENQDYQFDDLVDLLKIRRKPNRDPIFDIALTLTETNNILSVEEEGILKHHNKASGKVDLIFELVTYQEKLVMHFIYCDKLFLPQTIDRFLSYFNKIIDTVLADVNVNISDIKLIEVEEGIKQQREEVEFDI